MLECELLDECSYNQVNIYFLDSDISANSFSVNSPKHNNMKPRLIHMMCELSYWFASTSFHITNQICNHGQQKRDTKHAFNYTQITCYYALRKGPSACLGRKPHTSSQGTLSQVEARELYFIPTGQLVTRCKLSQKEGMALSDMTFFSWDNPWGGNAGKLSLVTRCPSGVLKSLFLTDPESASQQL